MRFKALLLSMLSAAFVCSITSVQAHDTAPTHHAITVQAPDSPHSGGTMKVKNASPRVMHFSIAAGGNSHNVISLAPLQEREFTGDEASEIRTILEGVFKPYVDDGSLVVDGQLKAPAPQIPTQTAGATAVAEATKASAAPSASDDTPDQSRESTHKRR